MLRSGLLLGAAAGLCTALLTMVDGCTAPAIERARDAARFAALRSLTDVSDGWIGDPDGRSFTHPDYPSLYVELREGHGYGGPMEVAVAFDGEVLSNLLVLRHQETPGIGDFIETQRSDWIQQFRGHVPGRWPAIDGRSGATITAEAMQRLLADPARRGQGSTP